MTHLCEPKRQCTSVPVCCVAAGCSTRTCFLHRQQWNTASVFASSSLNVQRQEFGFQGFGNHSPGRTDRKPLGAQTLGTNLANIFSVSKAHGYFLFFFFASFRKISGIEGGFPAALPVWENHWLLIKSSITHQINHVFCRQPFASDHFLLIAVRSLWTLSCPSLTFCFFKQFFFFHKKEYKAQRNTKLVIADECVCVFGCDCATDIGVTYSVCNHLHPERLVLRLLHMVTIEAQIYEPVEPPQQIQLVIGIFSLLFFTNVKNVGQPASAEVRWNPLAGRWLRQQ